MGPKYPKIKLEGLINLHFQRKVPAGRAYLEWNHRCRGIYAQILRPHPSHPSCRESYRPIFHSNYCSPIQHARARPMRGWRKAWEVFGESSRGAEPLSMPPKDSQAHVRARTHPRAYARARQRPLRRPSVQACTCVRSRARTYTTHARMRMRVLSRSDVLTHIAALESIRLCCKATQAYASTHLCCKATQVCTTLRARFAWYSLGDFFSQRKKKSPRENIRIAPLGAILI